MVSSPSDVHGNTAPHDGSDAKQQQQQTPDGTDADTASSTDPVGQTVAVDVWLTLHLPKHPSCEHST